MGSTRRRTARGLVALAATVGLLSSGPAAADWLVTRDGARVETRGGWEIKGPMVVFHAADGTYASMRLDALDLAASEAATEAARAAAEARRARKNRPAPLAPPAPKAKFVLTDDDVAHVDPATLPSSGANPNQTDSVQDGEQASEGDVAVADGNGLHVVSWDAAVGPNADGVAVTGVVGNQGEFHASNVSVKATALDLAGEVVGEGRASMKVNALSPGDQRAFRIVFPGVYRVESVRFEITSFNSVISDQDDDSTGDEAPAY